MKIRHVAILLFLAGCVDLSAVTKFSQTAPDVAKLDVLTDLYVSDPQTMGEWQSVWVTPDPALALTTTDREKQKPVFDELHALIVNYMKALGQLADSKVTDLSGQAKAVSSNLVSLQKSDDIKITAAQAARIGDLVTVIPQDLLSIWRGYEIGRLIKRNQAAFQAMIYTEIVIVQRYESDYHQLLAVVTDTAGMMDAAIRHEANPLARAARFAFRKDVAQTTDRFTAANSAAQKYVVALQKLGAAYDTLVQNSDHFTAATLQAILPDLNDATKAYADIMSL